MADRWIDSPSSSDADLMADLRRIGDPAADAGADRIHELLTSGPEAR